MQTYFGFSLPENIEKQRAPLTEHEKQQHLAYMSKTSRIMGMPFSTDRSLMEAFSRSVEDEQAAVTENVTRHATNILRLGEMIGVSSGRDSILPILPPRTREIFVPLYREVRPGLPRRQWLRLLGRSVMPKAVGEPRKAVPVAG